MNQRHGNRHSQPSAFLLIIMDKPSILKNTHNIEKSCVVGLTTSEGVGRERARWMESSNDVDLFVEVERRLEGENKSYPSIAQRLMVGSNPRCIIEKW